MHRLEGKKAIITGGSKNIGAGIAKKFALQGAEVVIQYNNDKEGANSTKDAIDGFSGKSHILHGDFSTVEGVGSFFKEAKGILGEVDILVNAAADYDTSHFLDLNPAKFSRLLSIGVVSTTCLMQMVAKDMIERGVKGSIINISSISGTRTSPNRTAHSSAKAALNMVTKSAALDLGGNDIRVNAIMPGAVPYEGGGEYEDEGQVIKRSGTPEDIANAALFLASEESSWVTGTIMTVDGGHTLSLAGF